MGGPEVSRTVETPDPRWLKICGTVTRQRR